MTGAKINIEANNILRLNGNGTGVWTGRLSAHNMLNVKCKNIDVYNNNSFWTFNNGCILAGFDNRINIDCDNLIGNQYTILFGENNNNYCINNIIRVSVKKELFCLTGVGLEFQNLQDSKVSIDIDRIITNTGCFIRLNNRRKTGLEINLDCNYVETRGGNRRGAIFLGNGLNIVNTTPLTGGPFPIMNLNINFIRINLAPLVWIFRLGCT